MITFHTHSQWTHNINTQLQFETALATNKPNDALATLKDDYKYMI